MATILGVGIATLDIINSVDGYPAEDAEVRATAQRICRGGNATNTLTVLSQLGHHCAWAGVLVDEPDARHIAADLAKHHIDSSPALKLSQGKSPTSYIVHNTRNGSRTIVHYRDLPEYPASAFKRLNLTPYHWLHFEGRNVADTLEMMHWARQQRPDLPLSLEIEKARDDIDQLIGLADVTIFSRHVATSRGFAGATAFLMHIQKLAPNNLLICSWGEDGAYALDRDGGLHHSPAFAPTQVVDTLGAGDTFNAGVIDACLRALQPPAILRSACQLAGEKCGHMGLDFINAR